MSAITDAIADALAQPDTRRLLLAAVVVGAILVVVAAAEIVDAWHDRRDGT